jgi:hypothetical protein
MAHGPWEAGLHPDAYRTNLCAYGHECKRRMCFFAHDNSELRTTASAGNSQQSQQAGGSSGHVQSGRTTGIVDGNIRGASQVSQMGAPAESVPTKRISPTINRGLSISMRGTETPSFLTHMIRDDFGDLAGSFRQHMTLDPESSVSDTGFGDESEGESLLSYPSHMVTTQQSLSEYRQVFEVYDHGHPAPPNQPTGSETENEAFSMSVIGGGVSRKRAEMKVGAMFTAAADVDSTLDSGQLLRHEESYSISSDNSLPSISQCHAQTSIGNSIGNSQSSAGLTQMYPEQIISCSEPVDIEADLSAGDNSGDKHQGVKRNLQVNIPIPTRSLNPSGASGVSCGVSPSDVMLKQDTSWVDKLLDSPIEAAQHVGGRRVYKFQ